MQNDISVVLSSVAHPRWPVDNVVANVPSTPGLYAAHADERAREELGLEVPPDDRPLYVGKSELSVLARELGMHLHDGRTGPSTLRRWIAALLRTRLTLRGVPRSPERQDYFDMCGLSDEHDRKLTEWMRARVSPAAWAAPKGTALPDIELEVIASLKLPLNLQGVVTSWTARKAARKLMADESQ